MIKCPNCNKELEDDSRFCDECGTPIPEVAEQTVEATVTDKTEEQPAVPEVQSAAPEEQPVAEVQSEVQPEIQPQVQLAAEVQSEVQPEVQSKVQPEVQAQPAFQSNNVIFCPNCGNQLPAGSLFCDRCGANIGATSNVDTATVNNFGAQIEKKKKFPVILAIVAAVAVLIIGVVCVLLLPKKSSKSGVDYAMYVKEKEIMYSKLKQKTASQVTSKLIDEAEVSNSDIADGSGTVSDYITISEDNKYIFYPDKLDVSSDGPTLYYKKLSKLDGESEKVDSDVYEYEVNDNSTYVTYLKGGDTIYSYDMKKKDKEKIAGDVAGFDASDDGKQVYYVNDEGTLYLWTMGKDKEKVDSDIYEICDVSDDFSTVYYIKEDNLYKKEVKNDREKIAGDVISVLEMYDSGHMYYIKSNEEEFDAYMFIEDDMKEEDENMTEPQYPSYFDYDTREQYNAAVKQYEEERDEYYKKRGRDYVREDLDEYTFSAEVYTLCYYDGKNETVISESYADNYYSASKEECIIYSEIDIENIDKVKLSKIVDEELSYYSIISDAIDESTTYSFAAKDKISPIDNENAITFRINRDGSKIMYLTDYDNEKETGELYMINVKDGVPGDSELIESDVYNRGIAFIGDSYKYFTDVKDDEGDLYIDGEEVAYDVYTNFGTNRNGVYYYYTDYDAEKEIGTLYYYENGKSEKMADDVYDYYLIGDKKALVLNNYSTSKYKGELNLYTNGKLKLLDDDVVCILVPTRSSSMSLYYYYGEIEQ